MLVTIMGQALLVVGIAIEVSWAICFLWFFKYTPINPASFQRFMYSVSSDVEDSGFLGVNIVMGCVLAVYMDPRFLSSTCFSWQQTQNCVCQWMASRGYSIKLYLLVFTARDIPSGLFSFMQV